MDYPASIFCGCSTCDSTCKLPRKQSQLCCVMVEPVILSCSHKFCFSCLNLTAKKCSVCGAASLDSISVDPLLQEVCDWFRSNEALLAALGSSTPSFANGGARKAGSALTLSRVPSNGNAAQSANVSGERPLPSPSPNKSKSSENVPGVVSSAHPTNQFTRPALRTPQSPVLKPSLTAPHSPLLPSTSPRKLGSSLPGPRTALDEPSPPASSNHLMSGAKKLAMRRESNPSVMVNQGHESAPALLSPNSKAALVRSPSNPDSSTSPPGTPDDRPSAPAPPPKPKNNPLRSSSGAGSPGDTPPPTPPLKPKKPTRLVNRPLSSPDLNKLTLRGPKAEDFKNLFASLGSGDFDATFGKSYDWATKPVDPSTLIWKDNEGEKLFARTDGWVNETRKEGMFKYQIEGKDKDVLWYTTHLHGKDHVIYLGGDEGDIQLFVVETCEHGEHPQPYKVLAITKDGVERIWIRESSSMKQRMKAIRSSPQLASAPKANHMMHVKGPEISQELLKWEQRGVFKSYKFGILYCKEGQSTEEEIFGNEHGSPEFEEFLQCMGDKIPLKGWTQYTGGLNVDAGLEGANSVYTQFEGFEIMFHVSTLLPFNPGDHQQLARKRHIGNDIVAIVFMDGPCPPLKPTFIKTQFIHVFIIVQLIRGGPPGQKPKYKISVAAKNDVRPFSPFLPPETTEMVNGPELREFLLTKLINAERSSLLSQSFKERMGKARQLFLNNLHEVYGK